MFSAPCKDVNLGFIALPLKMWELSCDVVMVMYDLIYFLGH